MTTTYKLKQGEVLKDTAFKNPGTGAIEFARSYIGPGHDYDEMLEIMSDIIDGYFTEVHDKKVKRCQCCGFYYRDKTKNNSATTCSAECKAGKDVVLKTYKRRVKAEQQGTARKSYKHGRYFGGEYPFWINDDAMFEYDRKHKIYKHGDDLEEVVARAQRRAQMGGKKRITTNFGLYEGEWSTAETQRLPEFWGDTPTTGGKCKIIKMTREEIEAELLAQYGERKLENARQRALGHAKSIGRI